MACQKTKSSGYATKMPSSKKSMSKTRQLSALVNFVSCLRSNRTKARTRALGDSDLTSAQVDCALVPTLTNDVNEVIAVLGPKEELDFEDFCLALARVALAHGAGKVSGEPDAIRALLVVIASSDGFAQAQRTPSRKSLRDFSPPSPMAALQL